MSIQFGANTAPSVITKYLDSLFSQSYANYSKNIADSIGTSNAFFHKIREGELYEGEEGGTDIRLPTLYELATMESYADYDEFGTQPVDGVTQSVWEWRQLACPIAYSMAEVLKNRNGLKNMVKTRIQQSELGIQEGWANAFFQGNGDGALSTPKTNPGNSSLSFEPLPKLVAYDPTASVEIGNINQNTSTWWRNKTKESAATTLTGFIQEVNNMYNTCSLGTGGAPDLIVCDQITYELFTAAYYLKYHNQTSQPNNFPFEATRFKKAIVTMDEKIPDVFTNVTSAATFGTMYFLNSKFFRVKYMKGRDFELLKDDNGKSFQKPLNGDSRVGHVAWMGQCCISARRKHGVIGKIARTLTAT